MPPYSNGGTGRCGSASTAMERRSTTEPHMCGFLPAAQPESPLPAHELHSRAEQRSAFETVTAASELAFLPGRTLHDAVAAANPGGLDPLVTGGCRQPHPRTVLQHDHRRHDAVPGTQLRLRG